MTKLVFKLKSFFFLLNNMTSPPKPTQISQNFKLFVPHSISIRKCNDTALRNASAKSTIQSPVVIIF